MTKYLLFFLMLPIGLFAQKNTTPLEVDIKNYNQIELTTLGDDTYDVKTLGADPYVFLKPLSSDFKKENNQLSFEYFCQRA
jgi:hypothetical protein